MREVALATTQMTSDWDREKNVANAIDLFRESTDRGTEIVQIQELFESPYFCAYQKEELFSLAPMLVPFPVARST
jgi:N-carbamoylputrescine amidase